VFLKGIKSFFRKQKLKSIELDEKHKVREIRNAYVTTMRGINILYKNMIDSNDTKGAKRLLYAKLSIQATYNKAIWNVAKNKEV
jgi:hypothetical protein